MNEEEDEEEEEMNEMDDVNQQTGVLGNVQVKPTLESDVCGLNEGRTSSVLGDETHSHSNASLGDTFSTSLVPSREKDVESKLKGRRVGTEGGKGGSGSTLRPLDDTNVNEIPLHLKLVTKDESVNLDLVKTDMSVNEIPLDLDMVKKDVSVNEMPLDLSMGSVGNTDFVVAPPTPFVEEMEEDEDISDDGFVDVEQ